MPVVPRISSNPRHRLSIRRILLAVAFISAVIAGGQWWIPGAGPALPALTGSASAQPAFDFQAPEPVAASLVAEAEAVPAGGSVRMALQLDIEDTWHTYWVNPGLVGFPPQISWNLPDGVTAGELKFPAPIRFEGGGAFGYGYEDQVLHPFTVEISADVEPGAELTLTGNASWLVCDPTNCIRGGAEVSITLTVLAPDAEPEPSADAEAVAEALERLPVAIEGSEVTATLEDDEVAFRLDFAGDLPDGLDLGGAFLFVEPSGLVSAEATAVLEAVEAGVVVARMPVSSMFAGEVPDDINVVVAMTDGKEPAAPGRAWRLGPEAADPPVIGGDEPPAAAVADRPGAVVSGDAAGTVSNVWHALFGAFIGGMILNLMPCVFPVISLKIMGFVNQAGGSRRHILYHGLVFAGGIMLSFAILAGILLALRAAGSGAGWGYQLQDPRVIMALSVLMFALALSLFGVFEIGTGAAGVGGKLANQGGLSGSFWSGVLATILASPCTAPLMGPALAFAMLQPPVIGMSIFLTLGLGMAAPYIVLSAYPKLIEKLPRPGAWMETFKQSMGFVMLGAVVWLLWVLAQQINADGMLYHFITLLLLALGVWVLGRFGLPHLPAARRWTARASAVILLAGAFFFVLKSNEERLVDDTDIYAVVEEHQRRGEHVFIDFTASWCITCQTNKAALYDNGVQQRLRENNIAFVVADWTVANPTIERMLAEYNRASIPFYVILRSDNSGEPVILPQLLTPGIVHDYLDRFLAASAPGDGAEVADAG